MNMPTWLRQLLPILILLAAIALVLARLPRVEVGHSEAFRKRRFWNWFPLGLTYSFLYFGRYNLNVATSAMSDRTDNAAFAVIFTAGTVTYAIAFLIAGPLTDRWGGRTTILLSSAGAALANIAMGAWVWGVVDGGWQAPIGLVPALAILYSINMFFQSFGAVSIVKVNAAWFHVRERGVNGGIFGILISLGLYFAYDWSRMITKAAPVYWAFFVPAAVLLAFFLIDTFLVRDSPGDAGHRDFDPGDASSGDTGPRLGVFTVIGRMLQNPIMLVILGIEFCSGFMRQATMQWYPKYAKGLGLSEGFVSANWGMLLCVAGITGGIFAGVISDRVFGSRRGPMSAVLYGGMTLATIASLFLVGHPLMGWAIVLSSLCVIGVHGMLSGTATADFGGRKNAGIATGIVDGAVYLGTAAQSLTLGVVLPPGGAAAADVANWKPWPWIMLPVVLVGFGLATRVWNARPKSNAAPAPGAAPVVAADAALPVSVKTGTDGR